MTTYHEAQQRKATDLRLTFLKAVIAACDQPITGHGMDGCRQVFALLASSTHCRKVRASNLLRARLHQLSGCGSQYVVVELQRAAANRRAEVSRRYVERSEGNLAVLDDTMARLREPVETPWSRPVSDPTKLDLIAAVTGRVA